MQKVPENSEVAYFALGCFWGAEKLFWKTPGVTNTALVCRWLHAQPTYEEVCSARTGHTEIVKVSYDLPRSATRSCSRSSSRTMTRHRACGKVTTSGRSTGRRSIPPHRSSWRRLSEYAMSSRRRSTGPAMGGSRPRSRLPASSTTRRTTTSSTWTRTPPAIARCMPLE